VDLGRGWEGGVSGHTKEPVPCDQHYDCAACHAFAMWSPPRDEAAERLKAAAPDLLEALQACVQYCPHAVLACTLCAAARAAIDKATGGAQ
jgi:hypothetical protein